MPKSIYNGNNYRKIWESHFGPIPKDKHGRTYEIHHKDGNRNNNDIKNLKCVSIQEHFNIHLNQGDYYAANLIARKMKKSPEELSEIASLNAKKQIKNGTHPLLKQKDGSSAGRNNSRKRVKNRTHNLLKRKDGTSLTKDRTKKGLNPLSKRNDGSSMTSDRIKNGTHPSQYKIKCPKCKKVGSYGNMIRWHFDNCGKNIKWKQKNRRKTVICPYCNKNGDISLLKRYHFNNCKFKSPSQYQNG